MSAAQCIFSEELACLPSAPTSMHQSCLWKPSLSPSLLNISNHLWMVQDEGYEHLAGGGSMTANESPTSAIGRASFVLSTTKAIQQVENTAVQVLDIIANACVRSHGEQYKQQAGEVNNRRMFLSWRLEPENRALHDIETAPSSRQSAQGVL